MSSILSSFEGSTPLSLQENYGPSRDDRKGSKRARLKNLEHKTKDKTKHLLGISTSQNDGVHLKNEGKESMAKEIESDPAFHPNRLSKKDHATTGETTTKAGETLKTALKAVIHPKEALKGTATKTTAAQLSKVEHPDLSQSSEHQVLQEQDELRRTEFLKGKLQSSQRDPYMESVQKLESHRESARVAWITGSHVKRVRVVPKKYFDLPASSSFKEYDEHGNYVRFAWMKWLGSMVLYHTQDFSAQYVDDFDELPFDIGRLRSHMERLVVASAPWQAWLMHVRRVYRWDNPAETAKWLALYVVLWYFQLIMTFLWAYILYMVIRNRYHPSSVESLRESIERCQEVNSKAHQFSELIEKYGREGWLEPLISDLGPDIQLQLGDLANILEVFTNFYAWKNPRKTAATLFFFASCLTVGLFSDLRFCMKAFWFMAGGGFFVSFPISSRYPKYRYLVSPIKWVFWDVPTHSEWSFQYLRSKAQLRREEMIMEKVEENARADSALYQGSYSRPLYIGGERYSISSSSLGEEIDDDDFHSVSSFHSILDESEFYSIRCEQHGAIGKLIVFSEGIRFVRSFPKRELWKRYFTELVEMRKLDPSSFAKMTSLQRLEFLFTDGDTVTIGAMKNADEAFNSIIGFSGLRWQSLQAPPPPPPGEGG